MIDKSRGKLLYHGIIGIWSDTIQKQKYTMIECIFLLLLVIFQMFLLLLEYFSTDPIPKHLIIFIDLFILLIIIFMISRIGFEIDAIYENGITNRHTSLIKYFQNRRFHRFEDITKVGFGTRNVSDKKSEFIVLYENNSKDPTVSNYTKIEYKNEFYSGLVEVLKQKCPNAKWEEIDWKKLPFTKA